VNGVSYVWDKKTASEGKASLCLSKTAKRYFPIAQWSHTVEHTGSARALAVSVQVKAERATKATVDVQFLDGNDKSLGHKWAAYIGAKKQGDPPANHDWKKYSGTVSIPGGTRRIAICLQIYGPGTVWFDDLVVAYAGGKGPKKDDSPSGSAMLKDGFEAGQRIPEGWQEGASVTGVSYVWDKRTAFEGKASLCLKKTAKRYFPIAQWARRIEHDGKSRALAVSAQVKARRASKATVDVQFLGAGDKPLGHKWAAYIGAAKPRDPPADHDWKEYSGTVPIPQGTEAIVIGLQIYGPGTVWFDNLTAAYAER